MSNFLGFLTVIFAILGAAMGWCTNQNPNQCADVYNNFASCLGYLQETYNEVSPQCCNGLVALNSIAKQEDGGKRRICQCIEDMAANGNNGNGNNGNGYNGIGNNGNGYGGFPANGNNGNGFGGIPGNGNGFGGISVNGNGFGGFPENGNGFGGVPANGNNGNFGGVAANGNNGNFGGVPANGNNGNGYHRPMSEPRINDLYYRCNIHLSFPISEHMDCTRV